MLMIMEIVKGIYFIEGAIGVAATGQFPLPCGELNFSMTISILVVRNEQLISK